MRRWPLLLFVLVASAVPAEAQSSDAFLAAHRDALALNQPGIDFQVRLKSGRTTFNPREPIEIELVFDPPSVVNDGMMGAPCRGGWALADVVLDPLDGVSTPQAHLCNDLAERPTLGILGGRPGGSLPRSGAPAPKLPPAVMTLTLNDWYRFDRPGAYRIYVRSAHPTGDGSDLPRQTSNVLAFTVTARDPVYEGNRIDAATWTLTSIATPRHARLDALRELRRLATEAALPALVRFYPSTRDEVREADMAMAGLLMVPDRGAAVAAFEGELCRPERALTPGLVRDLASLEVARRGTPRPAAEAEYLELVERYAGERARVLDAVPGRLEAAFRDDLREGGAFEGVFYRGVLGPVVVRYPGEVTAAFGRLRPREQRNLLVDSWRRFKDPLFVPLVRQLAVAPTAGDDQLRDIALRRWFELAPAQARPVLQLERARRLPRVSMATLARLDDKVGPALEAEWHRLLATESDRAVLISAAERLARFGRGRRADAVSRTWHRRWRELPVEASGAALAYLLRANQRHGLDVVHMALDGTTAERGAGRPGEGLLWQALSRGWTPVYESLLSVAFAHPDRDVWMDAVHLAREFGSPGTKGSLEVYLPYVLAEFAVPGALPHTRVDVHDPSDRLEALAAVFGAARGWTLSDAEAEAWAARCPSAECRAAFEHRLRHSEPDRLILVKGPTPGDEARLEFNVDGVWLAEEWVLLSKLRDYPPGTRFAWREFDSFARDKEWWTIAERTAKFEEIAYYAKHYGITVTTELRYVP